MKKSPLQCECLEDRLLLTQLPNIILIVTDDQRYDTLSYMPTVSGLAAAGVTYSNSFVTTPLCCPSRFSALTGQYVSNHRVKNNHGPVGGYFATVGKDRATLPVWLDDAGYRTGYFGRYLNGYTGRRVPPGWDTWLASLNSDSLRSHVVHTNLRRETISGDNTTYLARKLNQFIEKAERADDEPFFATFAPTEPHAPADPAKRHRRLFRDLPEWNPPSFDESDLSDKPRFVRAAARKFNTNGVESLRLRQLRCLQNVDDAVASLLDTLSSHGELDNTVIIYTSDNGLLWGEHGLRLKRYPYEESIRVPLFIWEGGNQLAQTSDELALNIDLAPTILNYAGAPIPASVDGHVLGQSPRDDFFIEAYKEVRRQFGHGFRHSYQGVHTLDQVFIQWDNGAEEFYDLAVDPYQLTNKVNNGNYLDEVTALRERLEVYRESFAD